MVYETPTCALSDPDPLPYCNTTGNTLEADVTYADTQGGVLSYEWSVSGNGWIESDPADPTLTYTTGPAFGGTVVVELTVTATYPAGEFPETVCESTCRVEFDCLPPFFCGFTQGYYGNAGGTKCFDGTIYTTQEILFGLLANDLTVGILGVKSLTIEQSDVNCLITRLPAGKTPTVLPSNFGDGELGSDPNCATTPNDHPIDRQGHWENILLGQTITLSLNVRLNGGENGVFCNNPDAFHLCPEFRVRKIDPVDYCTNGNGNFFNGNDVPDEDDPGTVYTIPQTVLDYLDANADRTVCSLLDLANLVLATDRKQDAPVPPGDVNVAVSAINVAFDDCAVVICCGEVGSCTVSSRESFIELSDGLPTEFSLGQNSPNPFNPTTRITLAVPKATNWTLGIYNVAGQLVQRFEGSTGGAAFVDVTWDGRDRSGRQVSTGVYFYKVNAGSFTAVKKMVMLK
jgi:hypothetical protein